MVSKGEFDRRYAAIREAMRDDGYEAFVVAGNAEAMQRCYIRYLTDWRLWLGGGFAVFQLEGDPLLVLGSGSLAFWAEQQGWTHDKAFASDKIGEVISTLKTGGLSNSTIGIVGLNQIMPYEDIQRLTSELPNARLKDATRLMDEVIAIKSQEEIAECAETYEYVARALHRVKEVLAPGKTEREVIAEAVHVLAKAGCLDGIAHISNGPKPYIRPPTSRVIQADDIIKVQLEYAGPSGYWMELSSIFSFREPPERELRHYTTTIKALNRAAALLRPGITGGEVSQAIAETYDEDGWKTIGRPGGFHGIGLNLVEPPFGKPGAKETLEENMVLMVSASSLVHEHEWGVFAPDNFVVTPNGGRQVGDHKHEWHVLPA